MKARLLHERTMLLADNSDLSYVVLILHFRIIICITMDSFELSYHLILGECFCFGHARSIYLKKT